MARGRARDANPLESIRGPAYHFHCPEVLIAQLMNEPTVPEILNSYNDGAPLAEALTIPAPWYVDDRIAALERKTVFSRAWQVVGRTDQVGKPGDYLTANVAGEPIVVVRGQDNQLRAFFNVC